MSTESQPELVVAYHAKSPVEANLVMGRLIAAGCNAVVQGGTPTDEVAMARQLMNTGGVKVMVPRAHLERAKVALVEVGVTDEELEAQALASGGEAAAQGDGSTAALPAKSQSLFWPVATVAIGVIVALLLLRCVG